MSVCLGKRRYASENDASVAVSLHRDAPMRWYVCPKGDHYHLTSEVALTQKTKKPRGMKRSTWRKMQA